MAVYPETMRDVPCDAEHRSWPGLSHPRLPRARAALLLMACLAGAMAPRLPASAAVSCDRLVDSGVRDCNTRLSLDTHELLEQTTVSLTPEQVEQARRQRPLRELAPSPEQFGQIQTYCRSHGEIRRRIGLERGLCEDTPRD